MTPISRMPAPAKCMHPPATDIIPLVQPRDRLDLMSTFPDAAHRRTTTAFPHCPDNLAHCTKPAANAACIQPDYSRFNWSLTVRTATSALALVRNALSSVMNPDLGVLASASQPVPGFHHYVSAPLAITLALSLDYFVSLLLHLETPCGDPRSPPSKRGHNLLSMKNLCRRAQPTAQHEEGRRPTHRWV